MTAFESFDDITCALSMLHDSYELLGTFLVDRGNLVDLGKADEMALSTLSVLNQTLADCIEKVDAFHCAQAKPAIEIA